MSGSKTEYNVARRTVHTVDLLRNKCRKPLAHKCHGQHDTCHSKRAAVGQHTHVYHHSNTYKEIRYEQRVSDKFD